LRQARREGDSPVSAALGQACVFIVALVLVPSALAATATRASDLVVSATSGVPQAFSAVALIIDVLWLSLPLMVASAFVAAVIGSLQAGGSVALKKLAPDLNRANPAMGLKNLATTEKLLSLARALVATALVAWLAIQLLLSELGSLASGVGQLGPSTLAGLTLAQRLAWIAALVGLSLSALDVIATRHSWLKRLRMTKDEVKREHKQAEGDPELKNARTRSHREMLAGASLNAVKEATVVIVNPTHLATALKYDGERDEAPTVISQGAGEFARRIIDAAHAYGVPVVRDVPVAQALAQLEIGQEIPEELYEAVAEVLREVFEAGADEMPSDLAR
jgi:flagellar biosynthesis protein FlhB